MSLPTPPNVNSSTGRGGGEEAGGERRKVRLERSPQVSDVGHREEGEETAGSLVWREGCREAREGISKVGLTLKVESCTARAGFF